MNKKDFAKCSFILIASIIIGFVPDWIAQIFGKNFTYDQVVYTAITCVILELLSIILSQSKVEEHLKEKEKIKKIKNTCNKDLCIVEKALDSIALTSQNENDVFVKHYTHQLNSLATKMQDSVTNQHLKVNIDHYVATNYVLSIFSSCTDKIWRFTWPFNSGDTLFSEIAWQRYFDEANKLITKKEIKKVKILIIVDDENTLNEQKLINLFNYAYDKKQIQIKWCTISKFNLIGKDSREDIKLDFGIYGEKLVFWYDSYEPTVTGTFSKDETTISVYSELFESIWQSNAIAHTYKGNFDTQITINELFERDRE